MGRSDVYFSKLRLAGFGKLTALGIFAQFLSS